MGIYKFSRVGLRSLMKEVDEMFSTISISRAESWKQNLWDRYLEAVHPKKIIALLDELERLEQEAKKK